MKDNDFVFLHIEASDEAGHEGDYKLKIKTIENLDSRVCKPILEAVQQMDEPVAIAVLPDHPTPCRIRTHTGDPVPFLIYRPDEQADSVERFSEHSAQQGSYGLLEGEQFINEFLK